MTQTHESYIAAVQQLAAARLAPADRERLSGIKMVYGAGQSGLRGVTYFNRWKGCGCGEDHEAAPFVEVCAFGQSSICQLAGTTLHELGHVLAGWEAGHGPDWKAACRRLGLRCIRAAGTAYVWAMFDPDLREAIARLPLPDDGAPVASLSGIFGGAKPKPCGAGVGTKGGKSRGKGSGSRLRLWVCECDPPIRLRVARDDLNVTCNDCGAVFKRG